MNLRRRLLVRKQAHWRSVPSSARPSEHRRVGVALGAGGAAALAGIGVLEELDRRHTPIAAIAGTSAGALVGAAYASGRLEDLRRAMCGVTRRNRYRLFDPTWSLRALFRGRAGAEFARPYVRATFAELDIPFAAVATDLECGQPVALCEGSVLDAVRASLSIPGIFLPQEIDGRLLVDGGLVNPVPVDVVRALGADFVIAVSTMADKAARPAGLLSIVAQAARVCQSQIAAARLREDPPDLSIVVRSGGIGLFDLHRSLEAIDLGRAAASAAIGDHAKSYGWFRMNRYTQRPRRRATQPARISSMPASKR